MVLSATSCPTRASTRSLDFACSGQFAPPGTGKEGDQEEAHLTLQRHLLQVLTSLAVQTLHAEFTNAYTLARTPSAEQTSEQMMDELIFYQHFIRHMYRGGLAALLRQYSALARLLVVTCDLWVEANIEFLQRLERDWSAIQQTFGIESVAGQVTMVQPALSDSHNGRRTVMALTFASGHKLVYKPRNVGMEESYYHLLAWCNEQGITPPFKILTILNRSSYGWVEFVEHEPCQDQQAAQRYYRRAGMLLCLVYVLGGVNCTHEHIIASGEHPVLTDAGILMHAYPCPDHQNEREQQCSDWEAHAYSVLHTGLLTNWHSLLNTSRPIDISTLGISSERKTPTQGIEQARPQNHHITLKYGSLKARDHMNIPLFKGTSLRLEEYREDIIAGFQQLYLLLLTKQDILLNPDSPFQNFKHQSARVIYRPDWVYNAVLPKLLTPESLRNGFNRSVLLERLAQDLIPVEYQSWGRGNRSRWWSVCISEQQALAQGDIPFFTVRTDSNALTINDGQDIAACFHQPGFDLVVARLQVLSDEDMSRQVGYIERVLCALRIMGTPQGSSSSSAKADRPRSTEPTAHELTTEALHIARDLADQAVHMQDGSATWLTMKFLLRSQRFQLHPMRYSLFDGISGVALFLAAAANISGEARYRELALAAVQPVCQQVRRHGDMLMREMGIGGAIGLGSVVYALTRISQFLDEPLLLADAKMAAGLIKAEHIAHDQVLDVIAGAAGTILGLLALYDASHDQAILERAILCGQHLLQARTMSKADCLVWPTLGGKHTTGFSHGVAGIAYALVRLYDVTHETTILAAARESLVYENCAFIREIGNWPDEPGASTSTVMTTWCHGAPGIGLARLGGLPVLDSARIRDDIEAALRTTQRIPLDWPDYLCCGNFGRAEFLFTAAHQLGRPELAQEALHNTGSLIARARLKGSFHLNNALPRLSIPNFFHGTAGIGYEFLRMAFPDTFPSVLLWK